VSNPEIVSLIGDLRAVFLVFQQKRAEARELMHVSNWNVVHERDDVVVQLRAYFVEQNGA
jgi:hypothetical protein